VSEKRTLVLGDAQQAARDLPAIWAWIKAMLMAGRRLVLEVRLETRSDAQNRLLHSRIGDIARQIEWVGKKRDTDTWKRLLTAAWLRARGEHAEILPALDGHGVDVVFERTSKLSRAECVELSDYIMAWGDEHGVTWRPASLGREWAGSMDEADGLSAAKPKAREMEGEAV
jgi:hypothetical protein